MLKNGFTFNGESKPYLLVIEKKRPYWAPVKRNLLHVKGVPGAYLSDTDIDVLVIDITVEVSTKSMEDLRKIGEDMAGWLVTEEPKELVFDDEPDRTYMAVVNGTFDPDELVSHGKGVLQFICPDPYRYGYQKDIEFTNAVPFMVEGTAETEPIIYCKIKQDTTFVAVGDGEEKINIVGNVDEAEDNVFEKETLILHDNMRSLVGWVEATDVDNGYADGTITAGSKGFYTSDFGPVRTPHAWQGASVKRALSETLQDFRMDVLVTFLNAKKGTGMIEIYLLDDSNNIVTKIGVEDIWRHVAQTQAKFQLGGLKNRHEIYTHPNYSKGWNNFDGMLRITREGKLWRPYWAVIQPDGKHVWQRSTISYYDSDAEYTGRIAQVQVAIRKFEATTPANMTVRDIKIYKINEEQGISYVARAGDIIEFNHQDNIITRNGEDITKEKAFIGTYFPLSSGKNILVVEPEDAIEEAKVRWRDKWR